MRVDSYGIDVKITNTRKQSSQVRRELTFDIVLREKLAKKDNAAIAQELFRQGIGVEEDGKLVRPYSQKYVSNLVRSALSEVAAERGEYGRSVQVQIDHDLETLITYWMPRALGEAIDDNGNPIPASIKAAELVRKLTADRALLTGANESKKLEIQIQLESTLDSFINTLRMLMPEDHFESVIAAITKAEQMNSEYWKSQGQKQITASDDIIDATLVDDSP